MLIVVLTPNSDSDWLLLTHPIMTNASLCFVSTLVKPLMCFIILPTCFDLLC